MGAKLFEIDRLLSHLAPDGNTAQLRILDIGCQNLYTTDAESVVRFFEKWGRSYDPHRVLAYARMICAGSELDPEIGGINGAWLGDVLSRAGFNYCAYDIFDGFNTRIFDLNQGSLPKGDIGAFDLILNCGTSEHVFNQWNLFKTIHEAVKPGGIMYHRVPLTGHLDHGYFTYQPRFFFDLAKANGYELIEASIGTPDGLELMGEKIVDAYRHYGISLTEDRAAWAGAIPTGAFSVIFRKIDHRPFRAWLETSTSTDAVDPDIAKSYGSDGPGSGEEPLEGGAKAGSDLVEFQRNLLERLDDPALGYDEIMHFYRNFPEHRLGEDFPLELERKGLQLALSQWPDRDDLRQRLKQVGELILQRYPVLAASSILPRDGDSEWTESELRSLGNGIDRINKIIRAYHNYFRRAKVRDFPLDLEYEAIEFMIREYGATRYLKLRKGKLLSRLTRSFDLGTSVDSSHVPQ